MTRSVRRLGRWSWLAAACTLLVASPLAQAQHRNSSGGGGGGGSIVFTSRRPPRDFVGNIRGWAGGARTGSYNENTQDKTWRVNFMAFLPRPPNAAEVILSWFHVEPNGVRRYITNEPIALGNPSERNFFHTTSLHRSPDEFQPMERYEAVLSVNDSRGARELARGAIQLIGQVERHQGVVDFTGAAPTVR